MQNVYIERNSQVKNETVEGFRLSPQQRHLWSLQQANLDQPYLAQGVVVIEGSLDLNTLKAAIKHVMRRNEILRTVFQSIAELDYPVQVITTGAAFSFEKHEPAGSELRDEETAIATLFQAANREPLDLERGPLFHTRVMSLSSSKHLLHVRVPALYADEIGLSALVREISVVYAALISDAEMPEEPMQYADVSEFLNEMLESKDTAAAKEYWRDKSRLDSAQVRLPLVNQTFAGEDFVPGHVSFVPDGDLMAKLKNLATENGRSLPILLQATWQLFLWRLTGQLSITIGVVHDGRTYEGLDRLPGLLARMLPLTCHFANDLSFADLLEQVSRAAVENQQWQDYFNLDHLAQNFIDNPPRAPFFPLGFEFSDPPASFNSADLKWTLCKQQVYPDRFVLKLHCVRTAAGNLRVVFHYDSSELELEIVENLGRNYLRLLTSLVADPLALIGRLEIVDHGERERLVREFNNTSIDFQTAAGIHELFEQQVKRTPGAVAVVYNGDQLTYAELNARANQLAHYLTELGVTRNTLVGLLMERSLTMVVSLLGVLKAGAAYVPLDPSYPMERLQLMIDDARSPVLLTQEELLEAAASNLATATRVVCVDHDSKQIARYSVDNPAAQTTPDDLAYVIYTSGSTGRPRGAMIPHRAITNHMLWMQHCFPLTAEDRVLQKTPFSFDASVWEFYAPLLSGAVLIMAAPGVQLEVSVLAKVIVKERVTVLQGVPSLLRVLVEEDALRHCRGMLRRVFSGGETLTRELAEALRERTGATVYNLYGPTETTIDATWWMYESGEGDTVPIGRPIANMQAYILNEEMRLAPLGVAGELYLGGAGLGRGYLDQPALTAEKFLPDPFSGEPGRRLYRTGDLVRYLSNGEIEYLGRNDQQLKLRGFRIELGEIEAVLEQHAGVKTAVVTLYEGARGQSCLLGYVVVTPESLPSNNELRSYLKARLPDYMVPQMFMVLDALPLLPNGKVDRRALPAPGSMRPDLEAIYVAPHTEIQEVLAAIWSQVLGIEQVGIHDNFFDLGGDSIRSVRMVALAKKRGLNFTVQQVFRNQTIARLERGSVLPGNLNQ